jgi:hypothetical protein
MAVSNSDYDLKALAILGVDPSKMGTGAKVVLHTPRRLQLAIAFSFLATLLFFWSLENAASELHRAIQTVGHDAAPSIVLAEKIKVSLADMDADVANELIAPPGKYQAAYADYESQRQALTVDLVEAAQNITYGDAEKIPIENLEIGLGAYEADVAQARVFHKRGGDPEVLPAYHQATLEMHNTLFPAADALDNANNGVLTSVYAAHKTNFEIAITFVWAFGIILLAALLGLQYYLTRTMRRLINPLLALASVLTVAVIVGSTASFRDTAAQIKVAKEDSFDSLYPLWHAKAVAYDANAAESRWLLDPSYGSQSAAQFTSGIAKLATFGPGETFGSVADAAQEANPAPGQWSSVVPQDFHGFLADEMRNVCFDGEPNAILTTMRDLGQYVALDTQIRNLQNSGRHADAIALCVGTNQGQSDWAYSQFDAALQSTIDINQRAFDKAVAAGEQELTPFAWLTPIVSIGIFALTLFGVLPRIKEYHFAAK